MCALTVSVCAVDSVFRSLESQLFNKVNELQEDISMKRFDLRSAQIQLAAVRAQVNVTDYLTN